jgi:hypothetical protein
MQERALLRGWIERRNVEHYHQVDAPVRILGATLCAYSNPTGASMNSGAYWPR